jgi:hypothetical protein
MLLSYLAFKQIYINIDGMTFHSRHIFVTVNILTCPTKTHSISNLLWKDYNVNICPPTMTVMMKLIFQWRHFEKTWLSASFVFDESFPYKFKYL